MNSTALGAEKKENIIFISDAHEKFYYEKLKDKAKAEKEHRNPGFLPSFIGGSNPPDARKEGVANGYIF